MADRYRMMLPGSLETRAAEAGDEDAARFRAVITTEDVDRYGDVVVAAGLDVSGYLRNPVVLFAHRGDEPIGRATRLWRENTRWLAEFQLASTDKAREVAQLIREKVLGAVSIGFQSSERPEARRGDAGEVLGMIFRRSELLEFSVVSVPANGAALIQRAVADDQAAPGLPPDPARSRTRHEGKTPHMTISSDVARLTKAHAESLAQAEKLYALAASEGRVLGAEERRAYEGHLAEAEGLAQQLADAQRLEKAMLGRAAPVDGGGATAPSLSTPTLLIPRSAAPAKPEKGIAFARYAMAVAASRGNTLQAVEIAKRWRQDTPHVEAILRAAVAPGTTTDAAWAGALVPEAQRMGAELLELLMPAAIVGRMNLRRVPFKVRIPRVTGGATAKWVGEGKAKPVSKAAFDSVALDFNKLAVISVLTEELVRFSDPNAETVVRDLLVQSITQAMDATFVSSAAAVAGVSPAGITHGVTATASSGGTVAQITADVLAVLGKFIAANIDISTLAVAMNPFLRLQLATMRTTSDALAFPDLAQGRFFGARVVDSNTVAITGSTTKVSDMIFVSEPNVLLAQDPAMRVDVSREAAVEMSDDPEADTGALVSLWQNNLIGLLVEQFITWAPARTAAVQVLSGVPTGK